MAQAHLNLVDVHVSGSNLINTYEIDDAEALRCGLLSAADLPIQSRGSYRESRFGERYWKASRLGNGKLRLRMAVESGCQIIPFPVFAQRRVCHG